MDALFAAVAPARTDAAALEALRQTFLQRATGHRYLDSVQTLQAYRAFFFPQTLAKVASVLAELTDFHPQTVVDLGAAMGPAAFAAWHQFRPKHLWAVDFSADALKDARGIAKSVGAPIETAVHDLANGWPSAVPKADLVLAANALSELPMEKRLAVVREILGARLNPGGALVLIEPADRLHARELQTLRDELLGEHAPMLPCPHAQKCPALVRPRDFCHEARNVAMPAWWTALATATGLSDSRMRFSYLVYRGARPQSEDVLRIISHPIPDKGRLRYLACGASGLIELARQNKHKNAGNAVFDELGRGALLKVTNATVREGHPLYVTVGADSHIDLQNTADPQQSRE